MNNWKRTYISLRPAFTSDLWQIDLRSISSDAKRRFFKTVKLVRFIFTEFRDLHMGFQCVALSYFGFFALVPMLATIFFVSQGLGLSDKLQELAHEYVHAIQPELIDVLIEKANNIIDILMSGPVGFVSGAIFLWTIIWLMINIERVFNNIYRTKTNYCVEHVSRKAWKKSLTYISLLVLIPFIVIIFGAGIMYYTYLIDLTEFRIIDVQMFKKVLSWIIFGVVAIFTISAMYKLIPQYKIRYKYALISAVISGVVFTGFQFLYISTQLFVTRLSAVYGVLAAIPLFMTWMNFSWQIIMYGCMLCRGFHNIDSYNLED